MLGWLSGVGTERSDGRRGDHTSNAAPRLRGENEDDGGDRFRRWSVRRTACRIAAARRRRRGLADLGLFFGENDANVCIDLEFHVYGGFIVGRGRCNMFITPLTMYARVPRTTHA